MYMFYTNPVSINAPCCAMDCGMDLCQKKFATSVSSQIYNWYWYIVNDLKGIISFFFNLKCTFLFPSRSRQRFHWCFVIIARFQMQPSQFFQGTKRWHVTRPLHCNYILCTFKTRSLLLSFQVMCVNVFTTIIMCFIVLSGIYANISLFLSYSEVTIATQIQSVSRSDGSSSHDGSAPGDDLYSPECQRRPCQLDELQRQNSSEDLIGHQDKTTRTRRILCRIWHAQELNHAMLVSSGQRRTAPRLSLVSPKVFYSISVTDGVLVLCRCRLWLAYLGTLGWLHRHYWKRAELDYVNTESPMNWL